MKNLFFILFSIALLSIKAVAQDSTSEILMTIDNQEVTLSEFENIYNKNNNVQTADHKTKDEYLELFINYKLKVLEAEKLGMDTLPSFKKELYGYQKQLAGPYLTNSELNDSIIKEAYTRLKTEISAVHILVKVGLEASPIDTLKAYNKIMEIRKRIVKGKEPFDLLVKQIQQKKENNVIAENLGYFSAFQMVYPFESAAFNTGVKEVSMPVRTSFGYHIIKVNDKRKSKGEIIAAHILVKSNAKSSEEEKINAEKKIQELYAKILAGEAFEDLAKQHSDDRNSAVKGGQLRPFTSGRMVPEFEKAAFDLQNDNDVSKPFLTQYGWHIVKRISKKELGDFDSEKGLLKDKVRKDRRGLKSRASFINNLKKEYNYQFNEKNYNEIVQLSNAEQILNGFKNPKFSSLKGTLFSLSDSIYSDTVITVSQKDFINYISKNTKPKKEYLDNIPFYLGKLFDGYLNGTLLDFEESILGLKYLDYKLLSKEYRDGILLFNLMDQKIWSKAMTDTIGLESFYNQNKAKFIWPNRIKGEVYSFSSEKIAKKARKIIKSNKMNSDGILAKFNETSQLNAQLDKGTFTEEDKPVLGFLKWSKGISMITKHESRYYVVKINETLIEQQKTLNDSRGYITSEYQTYLEEEWIKSLRDQYKVKVNQEVLDKVK